MAQEAGLKTKLNEDLRQALRSGDNTKRDTIRMALAAIEYAELARNAPVADPDILGVLAKDVRQHQESITEFGRGKRPDLVEKEEAELAIIRQYMPQQLNQEEIAQMAREVIAKIGARGLSDTGKVMGQLMPRVRGKADGAQVSQIVTQLLAG